MRADHLIQLIEIDSDDATNLVRAELAPRYPIPDGVNVNISELSRHGQTRESSLRIHRRLRLNWHFDLQREERLELLERIVAICFVVSLTSDLMSECQVYQFANHCFVRI